MQFYSVWVTEQCTKRSAISFILIKMALLPSSFTSFVLVCLVVRRSVLSHLHLTVLSRPCSFTWFNWLKNIDEEELTVLHTFHFPVVSSFHWRRHSLPAAVLMTQCKIIQIMLKDLQLFRSQYSYTNPHVCNHWNADLTWEKTDSFFQPIKVVWISHGTTIQDNQSFRCCALMSNYP